MLKRTMQMSLYLKLFLSFLAVCVLFFFALALFWNYYFSDLFYKDKREMLQKRADDLRQVQTNVQDGNFSSRELRITLRLLSRTFNGHVWISDSKATIVYSDMPELEGKPIGKALEGKLANAKAGGSGFLTFHVESTDVRQNGNFLIHYIPLNLNGQSGAAFLLTPIDDITEAISAVRSNIWVPLFFCLAAVGAILFIISRRLAGPLRVMNQAALALAEGDFTIRVPEGGRDEVGQLGHSFNRMVDQLQQWEDSRQDFLANVSHELRSPLTTLRGMILAMNDGVIPIEKQPHYLGICDTEVQRLQRLVNELLDLARIQNGKDAYRISRVNAVDAARETIDLLAPMIEQKGIRLKVWLPDESFRPPVVLLDTDRYAQILHNLLNNAVKFTPAGGLITVRMGIRDGTFMLQIRDTGIGMSQEETARIWDRFYKADPSRTGVDGHGTGLGLTIVKHLVLGMGGTINVQSQEGNGTEFTLQFPLAEEYKALK
jgi:signal transduction histidine kinase